MRSSIALALLGIAVAAPAMAKQRHGKTKEPRAKWPPLGLEEPKVPADNPQTPEKAALGRQLFWDARLSKSGGTSCEGCHHPDKGWADGEKLTKKDDGKLNSRNAPTLLDAAYNTSFYWDGRAPTLEAQILAAWKGQMGADDKTMPGVLKKLGALPGYKDQFDKVFHEPPTAEDATKAIAAYLRTLLSGDSAYDRFEAGDKKALSAAQRRGAELFKTKAKCSLCHAGFAFTAWEIKNIGVGMADPKPDLGRGAVKGPDGKPLGASDPKLNGAFKVPTLRNVSRTAPYMHDGRFATLAEVIDYFAKPTSNSQIDDKIKGGVQLTAAEKSDLLEFLKALDGSEPDGSKPPLP